jgi:tRNA(Ile)-lysidine synthase
MSSRSFLTRFHEFSRRKGLLAERDRIIAAVSGGVDSAVLLDLLAREQDVFGLSIIVAHFNFRLRGEESDRDEAFVVQRARHYGFEMYVERADTAEHARKEKMGIQEAARALRYEFFDKLLLSSGFDKIATAHNADDNAETIVLNLARGAGVSGLAGIPVYRPDRRIIRPLLFAERNEIEEYARAEHIPFRTDSSNAEDAYTRNFIRHHIMPLLRERVNAGVVGTLHRSAELFRELEEYLRYAARQQYESVVVKDSTDELQLSVPRLRTVPVLIQQYVVMLAAEMFTTVRPEYVQVNSVLELTEGLTGSHVELDKGYVVYRDRDHLVFRRTGGSPRFRFSVLANQKYEFEGFTFSSEVIGPEKIVLNGKEAEYVDADKIPEYEMILRSWADGDAFVPLGMTTKKKISDFFVDAKIPMYEKPLIPILATKSGDIVWVCGHRIDERFKVTPATRRVLRLQFSTTENRKGAP